MHRSSAKTPGLAKKKEFYSPKYAQPLGEIPPEIKDSFSNNFVRKIPVEDSFMDFIRGNIPGFFFSSLCFTSRKMQ